MKQQSNKVRQETLFDRQGEVVLSHILDPATPLKNGLWRFDCVMHRIPCPGVFIQAFSWFTLHLWGRLVPEWVDEQSRASWQRCYPGRSDPVITVDVHICLLLNTPQEGKKKTVISTTQAAFFSRSQYVFHLPTTQVYTWVCRSWENQTSFDCATQMVQGGKVWQRSGILFWQTA